ncbi:Ribosomal protein L39e domain-containing protein [Rozella allomycis CSF55]|uniref:Large ribosomal subunit protein eL39 n=2 Tax=Rozella allomycis (strain CSF55) TaxID=988480 RepID=A0A075AX40_ROZAC|nr:Ribosomal protein L39e domain-containing protein [Rozella allomycis CSF55]|eukprot:EPZ34704.1 Ribosomal protein L39e domain-containing protein [Rozella allomycis CSF55]
MSLLRIKRKKTDTPYENIVVLQPPFKKDKPEVFKLFRTDVEDDKLKNLMNAEFCLDNLQFPNSLKKEDAHDSKFIKILKKRKILQEDNVMYEGILDREEQDIELFRKDPLKFENLSLSEDNFHVYDYYITCSDNEGMLPQSSYPIVHWNPYFDQDIFLASEDGDESSGLSEDSNVLAESYFGNDYPDEISSDNDTCSSYSSDNPSQKSFKIKRILGKKMKQNRPIPHWIRLRTDNKIRYNAKRRHWRRTKLNL